MQQIAKRMVLLLALLLVFTLTACSTEPISDETSPSSAKIHQKKVVIPKVKKPEKLLLCPLIQHLKIGRRTLTKRKKNRIGN